MRVGCIGGYPSGKKPCILYGRNDPEGSEKMIISAIRWFGALLSAAAAYVAVFLIVSLSWSYLGGDATEALKYRNMLSAAFSVWAAAAVAPKSHWRRAAYITSALLVTIEAYSCVSGLLDKTITSLDIMNAFFTAFGCVGMTYLLHRSHGHQISPVWPIGR